MANNCLVTKLKGVVDNNNIPVYGCIKVDIFQRGVAMVQRAIVVACKGTIKSTVPLDIYNLSGEVIYSQVTQAVFDNTDTICIVFPDLEGTAWLPVKYEGGFDLPSNIPNIGSFGDGQVGYEIDMSQLEYFTGSGIATSVLVAKGNFEPSTVLGNLVRFDLIEFSNERSGSFVMDLSIVPQKMPNLTSITLNGSMNVSGNVTDLSMNVALTLLNLRLTKVTGNLEDLFNNMFANGRTSGTLQVQIDETAIKYNGSSYTRVTATFTPEGWTAVAN